MTEPVRRLNSAGKAEAQARKAQDGRGPSREVLALRAEETWTPGGRPRPNAASTRPPTRMASTSSAPD